MGGASVVRECFSGYRNPTRQRHVPRRRSTRLGLPLVPLPVAYHGRPPPIPSSPPRRAPEAAAAAALLPVSLDGGMTLHLTLKSFSPCELAEIEW
jgi:hypothetical protein